MNDPDLDRVLRSTSISSLRLTGKKGQGTDREKGKEKEREKGKEKDSIAQTNELGQLIHTITPSDTLEGIAVKYGVQLAELKRVNKLWTKGDMFARKHLIIPFAQDYGNSPEEITLRFITATKCKEEEATPYLQRTNFNFNEAVRLYREDLAKKKARREKKHRRENGDITTHLPPKEEEVVNLLTLNTENEKVRLRQVERKTKERLEKEEEKLFDL